MAIACAGIGSHAVLRKVRKKNGGVPQVPATVVDGDVSGGEGGAA